MTKLPLATGVEDAREGKESALWNALKEQDEQGEAVTARPGLATVTALTGAAGGLTCFGGELASVSGTDLKVGISITISTVASGLYDFAQSPL